MLSFCTKLYRQINGIPMCKNWPPLVADAILFCNGRNLTMSLSDDKQTDNL